MSTLSMRPGRRGNQVRSLAPARRLARVRPSLMLGILLAGFLAARVVVWAGGKVFTSYDTFSYAYRNDPAHDRGPLVSFTGHAPRLWGAPALYALFDSDTARAITQWTIGTLAWAALAAVLWRRLTTAPARALASAGVLGLALTPQVTSWDLAILSESLSISLGVLALALFLCWSDPATRHPNAVLAALTGCAFWWTFTRPDIRLMTAVLVAAIAGRAWAAQRRGRDATRSRRRWLGPATAVTVLAGSIVWVGVITPTADRTFAGWSATGLSLSEETLNYRLRLQVLPDPEIKAAYTERLGMPECPAADRVAAGPDWAIVEFAGAYRSCPDLAAWGRRNAGSSGYRFAVTAPGPYLRYTWSALPGSVAGAVIAHTGTPLPVPVQRAAFPPDRWLAPAALAALAAALLAGGWTRHRTLVSTAVVLAVASVTSIVVQLMYAVGVLGRYGIQEAIAVRLSILVLIVAALDAALRRRARTPSP